MKNNEDKINHQKVAETIAELSAQLSTKDYQVEPGVLLMVGLYDFFTKDDLERVEGILDRMGTLTLK